MKEDFLFAGRIFTALLDGLKKHYPSWYLQLSTVHFSVRISGGKWKITVDHLSTAQCSIQTLINHSRRCANIHTHTHTYSITKVNNHQSTLLCFHFQALWFSDSFDLLSFILEGSQTQIRCFYGKLLFVSPCDCTGAHMPPYATVPSADKLITRLCSSSACSGWRKVCGVCFHPLCSAASGQ